jgi:hypothetical protein
MNTRVFRLSLFVLFASTADLYAHVELDYPVGGETFVSGTTINIQWHIAIAHNTLNWDLYYSTDGGMSWEAIQENLPAGSLSYQWLVPGEATSLARVSVIQDNDGQDYQDESSNFTITTSTTSIPDVPVWGVDVYPNPAHEFLEIDFDESKIMLIDLKLFDLQGKPVWYYEDKTKVMRIPVRYYPDGVYILQIITDQGVLSRKIFIQHS